MKICYKCSNLLIEYNFELILMINGFGRFLINIFMTNYIFLHTIYTHLPKVSGQNVDHINVHDVFICFTQKFTKTSKKTRLIFLSECSQKIRKNVFLLVL